MSPVIFLRSTSLKFQVWRGGAVKVTGARGFAPSSDYKVCATYMDGYRATAVCPVGGPRATDKARRTADSIIKRTRRIFTQQHLEDFTSVNIQVLGAEDTYGPHRRNLSPREVVLWMAVCHKQKKALEVFAREIAPAGTGMAPGLMGIVGGRPRVSPVLKPFFFMHPKSQMKVEMYMDGGHVETHTEVELASTEAPSPSVEKAGPVTDLPSGPHTFRLEDLAYTRSGDKGDSSNIGTPDRGRGGGLLLPPHTGRHAECCNTGKAYGQMLLDLKLSGLPDLKSLVG
ncbi:uncharacterized protein LOC114830322 isoform X3 [Esox lucius]|uniref:uncharacterized protein LOC114830322 isoform X3 n=1 Tax=Esox lucius TaxID=8010 RepID=UPI0014773193|nr:uncharacterized protein LOC114830322 isoform X3 [Esox lucius]